MNYLVILGILALISLIIFFFYKNDEFRDRRGLYYYGSYYPYPDYNQIEITNI